MSAFLITFRETLEATIIVGLIFSILNVFWAKRKEKMYIIFWVLLGVLSSVLFAFLLEWIFWEFEWSIEEVFEGTLMLVATIMITHFVVWTNSHFKNIWKKIKKWVETALSWGQLWILTILSFVSVIREWVETVIFLKSAEFSGISWGLFYAFGGFLIAIIVAWVLFYTIKVANISSVIKSTNFLFLLLWAWLLSHAISEFEWAGIIPQILKPLFDLNETFLTEKSWIWSFLKAGFSYDANPSITAFIAYISYICIVGYILFFRKKKSSFSV